MSKDFYKILLDQSHSCSADVSGQPEPSPVDQVPYWSGLLRQGQYNEILLHQNDRCQRESTCIIWVVECFVFQARRVIFEQELYDQFTYSQDKPYFHSFPGDVSF